MRFFRYRAQVIPLHEGHRQTEKAFWGYTDAASIAQAGRFLRMRYPYPLYVVEEPIADPRVETHEAQLRVKLIQLKTDIEKEAPELEEMYRGALENALDEAKRCNLYGAIKGYEFASSDVGELIRRRILSDATITATLATVEDLAVKAIVEELTAHCGCILVTPPSEEP